MRTLLLVLAYLSFCLILGLWSRWKGHAFWLGFSYSFLLTPLIGALTIALTQPVTILQIGGQTKRSCPHCFGFTPTSMPFCELCGRNIKRHTLKGFLQLGELFIGLIATIVIVRMLMQDAATKTTPASYQQFEQARPSSGWRIG